MQEARALTHFTIVRRRGYGTAHFRSPPSPPRGDRYTCAQGHSLSLAAKKRLHPFLVSTPYYSRPSFRPSSVLVPTHHGGKGCGDGSCPQRSSQRSVTYSIWPQHRAVWDLHWWISLIAHRTYVARVRPLFAPVSNQLWSRRAIRAAIPNPRPLFFAYL